jgi:hypothetical protein
MEKWICSARRHSGEVLMMYCFSLFEEVQSWNSGHSHLGVPWLETVDRRAGLIQPTTPKLACP